MSVSVVVDSPNVSVTTSVNAIALTNNVNSVSVATSNTSIAVQADLIRQVIVNSQSSASIDDDPYLEVKRLREVGPSVASLTYNVDGTLATKTYAGGETMTYTYSAGALVSATDGTFTTAYTYAGGQLDTVTRS